MEIHEIAAEQDWRLARLAELIAHIVSTHHEYLKLELPRTGQRLKEVNATYGERDSATLAPLSGIFSSLWDEMDMHMHKEERMLFPAIEALERSASVGHRSPLPFGTLANPVRVMLAEHDSAVAGLSEIRTLTNGYTLPADASDAYRELFQSLDALDRDLRLHIHLENDILFPRALSLESA